MFAGILSILAGFLGGFASIAYSFVCMIVLAPLMMFKSSDDGKTLSLGLAFVALCLLMAGGYFYDWAVIKIWSSIAGELGWCDYIGIVLFCVTSACIPDTSAGDALYNRLILNSGLYGAFFMPCGILLMKNSCPGWGWSMFVVCALVQVFMLVCFRIDQKSLYGSSYDCEV